MTLPSLKDIKLTNVYHESQYGRKYISFKADDRQSYRMVLIKDKDRGIFEPVRVYHKLDIHCLLCDKEGMHDNCSYFGKHLDALFQRLIQFPSIRLEWLFIPHAGGGVLEENSQ